MFSTAYSKDPKRSDPRAGEDLQIFDLLQLSRQEQEIKTCCRYLLTSLSTWKQENTRLMPSIAACFFEMRGILLRQQARKAVQLYWIIRQKRKRCFNAYLAKLPDRSQGRIAV